MTTTDRPQDRRSDPTHTSEFRSPEVLLVNLLGLASLLLAVAFLTRTHRENHSRERGTTP